MSKTRIVGVISFISAMVFGAVAIVSNNERSDLQFPHSGTVEVIGANEKHYDAPVQNLYETLEEGCSDKGLQYKHCFRRTPEDLIRIRSLSSQSESCGILAFFLGLLTFLCMIPTMWRGLWFSYRTVVHEVRSPWLDKPTEIDVNVKFKTTHSSKEE